jgi:dTDP-4-amino-4,6-dideoxygalactose transaminase
MIYYPGPLHLQKAYRDLGYKEGDLPVAEALCSQVLSLPMHTELEKEQLEYISETLQAFFKS